MQANRWLILWVLICISGIAAASPGGDATAAARPAAEGRIIGVITGPGGEGLAGVNVRLLHVASRKDRRIVSGPRGVYRVESLNPGVYEWLSELDGFAPKAFSDVRVAAGETVTLNVALDWAQIQRSVTVTAALPRASLQATETRDSSARDIGEALSEVDGVSKVRKGGIANDVVLRGLGSKDLNVLIDGQRIYGACPNHMDPAVFHADFAEVDRIEISKGPFDVKNQGGFGGLINVVTRQPKDGLHASGVMSGGSYRYLNPTATLSYGAERFHILAGYSYRKSDPYSDGSGRRFTETANFKPQASNSDAFRVGTVWTKAAVNPRSNQSLQVSFAHQEADHVLYPYLMMDAVYDDSDRANVDYLIDGGGGALRLVRFQAYFSDVRHWMTDDYRTSSLSLARTYSMGTMAKTRTWGGKVEASLPHLLLGVEAFRRSWDSTTEMAGSGYKTQFSIPGVNVDSAGLYGVADWTWLGRLTLTAGARLDTTLSAADAARANTDLYYAFGSTRRTSVRDTYPSGSLSLSYRVSDAVELRTSLGSVVRVPDARERFFGLRRMGSDWVGNPELRPSRNTGGDLSFSLRGSGFAFEASAYLSALSDFVIVLDRAKANAVPGVMNSHARTYQNVDARMAGADANLAYSINSRISLMAGVSYVRGTQEPDPARGITSGDLAEIPPLSGRTGIRYDDGFLMVEVEGIFVARQSHVNTDLREGSVPGYGVANAKVGVRLAAVTIRLGVDNILDNDYVQYLSFQRDPFRTGVRVREPGASVFLNLSYLY